MSEQPQDITQKHLYISDPDHPHYPEQGYLTGEVISLLGMPMAKFKLDNCRHGGDACFVSKGQLSPGDHPTDDTAHTEASMNEQSGDVMTKLTTTMVDSEWQQALKWRERFLAHDPGMDRPLQPLDAQIVCYLVADCMTMREVHDQQEAAEKRQAEQQPGDVRQVVALWRETRASYARGPVILAHVMDLGSKLADALEALTAQPSEVERPALHQRAWDLLRQMRGHLADENLISDEEYVWLAIDAPNMTDPKGGSPAPRRLESYDETRERAEKAETLLTREVKFHGETIDQRDRAQEMADELAERVVALTVGGDTIEAIGEHASANDPWKRAIELADDHLASPPAPSGWQQRIAAMDPMDDVGCFFCGTGDGIHDQRCLWQNAKDALPPSSSVGSQSVENAARALVAKLDAVHSNASWQSVMVAAHVHGFRYNGPTYGQELEALRKALDALPPAPPAEESSAGAVATINAFLDQMEQHARDVEDPLLYDDIEVARKALKSIGAPTKFALGQEWVSRITTSTGPEVSVVGADVAPVPCKARRCSTPEPQDCDWPFCGCDERATKVIEALVECGWGPREADASPAKETR